MQGLCRSLRLVFLFRGGITLNTASTGPCWDPGVSWVITSIPPVQLAGDEGRTVEPE
jgi:hypothetical protein